MGLHDEIVEQPRVARRLLSEATNEVNKVAAAVQAIDPAGAFAAARGTSDHAATYLKYLLEGRNEFPVALAAPSVFTLYGRAPRVNRFLVLGISQSGAPEDVVTVVRSARSQGALTVAVTNEPGSDLAQAAEHVLHCRAGTERSVAATKTYTSTLLLTALLATAMSGDEELAEAVHRVPTAMQLVLDAEDRIAAVAEVLPFERMVVLGRGFQLATALETALKITETSYVMAEGKSSADFLHGPIAMTEPGFPVLLFESCGPTLGTTRKLATTLADRGAHVVRITDDLEAEQSAKTVPLVTGLPEPLAPLAFAVAGQLFAYHFATAHGRDPDRPRGLTKVTQTF